jgi:hypothetical protein
MHKLISSMVRMSFLTSYPDLWRWDRYATQPPRRVKVSITARWKPEISQCVSSFFFCFNHPNGVVACVVSII